MSSSDPDKEILPDAGDADEQPPSDADHPYEQAPSEADDLMEQISSEVNQPTEQTSPGPDAPTRDEANTVIHDHLRSVASNREPDDQSFRPPGIHETDNTGLYQVLDDILGTQTIVMARGKYTVVDLTGDDSFDPTEDDSPLQAQELPTRTGRLARVASLPNMARQLPSGSIGVPPSPSGTPLTLAPLQQQRDVQQQRALQHYRHDPQQQRQLEQIWQRQREERQNILYVALPGATRASGSRLPSGPEQWRQRELDNQPPLNYQPNAYDQPTNLHRATSGVYPPAPSTQQNPTPTPGFSFDQGNRERPPFSPLLPPIALSYRNQPDTPLDQENTPYHQQHPPPPYHQMSFFGQPQPQLPPHVATSAPTLERTMQARDFSQQRPRSARPPHRQQYPMGPPPVPQRSDQPDRLPNLCGLPNPNYVPQDAFSEVNPRGDPHPPGGQHIDVAHSHDYYAADRLYQYKRGCMTLRSKSPWNDPDRPRFMVLIPAEGGREHKMFRCGKNGCQDCAAVGDGYTDLTPQAHADHYLDEHWPTSEGPVKFIHSRNGSPLRRNPAWDGRAPGCFPGGSMGIQQMYDARRNSFDALPSRSMLLAPDEREQQEQRLQQVQESYRQWFQQQQQQAQAQASTMRRQLGHTVDTTMGATVGGNRDQDAPGMTRPAAPNSALGMGSRLHWAGELEVVQSRIDIAEASIYSGEAVPSEVTQQRQRVLDALYERLRDVKKNLQRVNRREGDFDSQF
ncbi:hypothetical protein LTR37_000938 [Vermiconidia calcicola]|uniref:Uncharacterized protein n=1 Tax=Vermiconidia calcicola TaxID=1690605 RepID=A0ACC3NX77_9PEZI|nr:hypothetical protein LTR37_000938 [Vermiconidia calcicola]